MSVLSFFKFLHNLNWEVTADKRSWISDAQTLFCHIVLALTGQKAMFLFSFLSCLSM